ncbi:nucleotidyl transferase AbiEii/AbiGii toxin family protein [Pseudomonas saliphila]|uniref:nucleotidyl transferase AbiEii/AbiGii toxin family protein n=1 Tax=Pseudomonas saliphila TaxID=2586906 RepID=UPI0019D5BE58|nr:nucleotidyl transferase AbiEii/AbiGii toxin family protein [Pseudomonas saliphila]
MKVIEQMLQRYPQDSNEARTHALREVMQQIALAGLYRGGFFDVAAFYGGTCLRIFHELPRFSESLDFSLLQPNPGFALDPYFNAMQSEFAPFGFEVEISAKPKAARSDIASAFLKKTASVYDLRIAGEKLIKIKFEVDTDPPLGFVHEEKLLLQPYSFYVKCFALPDLFAGKMHALLFRRWKNRVKGRDWFDIEWYIRRGCPLSLEHFAERARQSGDLDGEVLTEEAFLGMLEARIRSLDVESARKDVARFIKTRAQLDIWSQDYFLQLIRMIRFQ